MSYSHTSEEADQYTRRESPEMDTDVELSLWGKCEVGRFQSWKGTMRMTHPSYKQQECSFSRAFKIMIGRGDDSG